MILWEWCDTLFLGFTSGTRRRFCMILVSDRGTQSSAVIRVKRVKAFRAKGKLFAGRHGTEFLFFAFFPCNIYERQTNSAFHYLV